MCPDGVHRSRDVGHERRHELLRPIVSPGAPEVAELHRSELNAWVDGLHCRHNGIIECGVLIGSKEKVRFVVDTPPCDVVRTLRLEMRSIRVKTSGVVVAN